jgi:hypothetical protein
MSMMDTPERLWRTQLTDEMMERVLKQVIAIMRDLERKAPWRDQLGPDDRLSNVILKILDWRRNWDPERGYLERFLLWAIAGDITHEIEHDSKFRRASLDDENLNQEDLEGETSESLADERDVKTEVTKELWWSKFIDQLREHVEDEPIDDRQQLAAVQGFKDSSLRRHVTSRPSHSFHSVEARDGSALKNTCALLHAKVGNLNGWTSRGGRHLLDDSNPRLESRAEDRKVADIDGTRSGGSCAVVAKSLNE